MKILAIKIVALLVVLAGMFAGGFVLGKTMGDDRATRQWESLYQETLFTHALTFAAHEHRIRQSLKAGNVDKALDRVELGIDRALMDASLYAHPSHRWELFFLSTKWSDLKADRADFANKRNPEEDKSINDVLDLMIARDTNQEPQSAVVSGVL